LTLAQRVRGLRERLGDPAPWRQFALAGIVGLAAACGGGGGGGGDTGDPTEAFSGGDTTVFDTSDDAFGFPLANLSSDRSDMFFVGNSFFRTNWVTAPSSTTGRDGLGPLFNAVGCSSCHLRDGRGRPPVDPGERPLSLLLKIFTDGVDGHGSPHPDPTYGDQIQTSAILGVSAEAEVEVSYEEVPGAYADGTPYSLRRPSYELTALAYGPVDPEAQLAPRVAPAVFGMGLLAAVPEGDLLQLADESDADGDGISGRPNVVWDRTALDFRLGRFGWKASHPTIAQQAAAAFLADVGLTSDLFPAETCTGAQGECSAAPNGGSPEVLPEVMDPLVFYMETLAPPGRRAHEDPEVRRGRDLFNSIGCASCHVTTLVTGDHPTVPELSGHVIHAYTDLLLHDLGPELADGRPDGVATGSEWRTPPLWGIGLVPTVSGHSLYLHDGRARGFAEAILWHGGEALASREAFRSLSAVNRQALLRFLGDL
jgi:CxxC motif-containing protein (DUF1111 family)